MAAPPARREATYKEKLLGDFLRAKGVGRIDRDFMSIVLNELMDPKTGAPAFKYAQGVKRVATLAGIPNDKGK